MARYSGGATFYAKIVAMVLFDTPPAPPAPGFQTGWQLIGSTYTLTDENRLNLTASVQFYDFSSTDQHVLRERLSNSGRSSP